MALDPEDEARVAALEAAMEAVEDVLREKVGFTAKRFYDAKKAEHEAPAE